MNPISINAVTCDPQPTSVNETPDFIRNDQFAIDGSMQRDDMGKKKKAVLFWRYLTFTQYQALTTAFDAGVVHYKNLTSNVSATGVYEFDGLASYEPAEYISSGSPLIPLTVTIREK